MGTWGRVRRKQVGPRRFQARARFRDYDGVTRNVEAWAETGAAAERALMIALRDRATPTEGEITRETRINQLADLWLDEIIAEDRLTPQTISKYEALARKVIIPALGNLRLREISVGRIDRLFKNLAAEYPTKARHTRVVLGQMLGMAVRHDALRTNPVRDTARLRRPTQPVRALAVDELTAVRTAIRRWQTAPDQPCGPRRTTTLADIVDILLATGGRIGEVLALRWTDIDLTGPKTTVTFAGTLVYVKGTGFCRQPRPKSAAGYRTLTVPSFATAVLGRRHHQRPEAAPDDPVFPSRNGTWLSSHNVRRQWREARHDTGFDWATPHTFRKTVATLIDAEDNTKTAAAQLGHTSEDITTTHYIQKPHTAPDSSDLLEALGRQPGPDDTTTAEGRDPDGTDGDVGGDSEP